MRPFKTICVTLLFFSLFHSFTTEAQNSNEVIDRMQERYRNYKSATRQKYDSYRDQLNQKYCEWLKNAWCDLDGNKAIPIPDEKDDLIPPTVAPEEDRKPRSNPISVPIDTIIPLPEPDEEPVPTFPIIEQDTPIHHYMEVNFYGSECRIRFDINNIRFLSDISEASLIAMWEHLYANCDNTLYDLWQIREDMYLCDWAYLKLCESLAAQIYPARNNEQMYLQAYILIQSGFDILFGRDDYENLHILLATNSIMYEKSYWTIEENEYYCLSDYSGDRLNIMPFSFPQNVPLRLDILQENRFEEHKSQPRHLSGEHYPISATVQTNINLMDFYNDYPASYANHDGTTKWRFYANTPLASTTQESLYPSITQAIKGKSEIEAVQMILNFVQTAFEYEYDDVIWGQDRVFFADESLYYPYCDCEDRSILFSRLIRDILHLDVVLVFYPGHLYTAVAFNSEPGGDYITIEGKRYTICDPTYIPAAIGCTMPGMDNNNAIAIKLN